MLVDELQISDVSQWVATSAHKGILVAVPCQLADVTPTKYASRRTTCTTQPLQVPGAQHNLVWSYRILVITLSYEGQLANRVQ
jgi:hypothetical protein